MEIKAGDLDRRIIIESETITKDAWGAEVVTWGTLASVWAKVDYNSGRETTESDQNVSLNLIAFTIRYRSDVTARNRIYYNSKYFTINYINNIGREDAMVLYCDLRDHN